jgi:hypothetical protein
MPDHPRSRVAAFAVVTIACVLLAVGYAMHASRRTAVAVDGVSFRFVEDTRERARFTASDHVLYRTTAVTQAHGRLAISSLADTESRYLTSLECERVDVGGGTGVCLTANRGFATSYGAVLFDRDFSVRHRLTLTGIPSRTRVSPDGKLAAVTTFVSGHSYAGGSFSTRTVILDTSQGQELTELERFTVTRDGHIIKAVDFNFWGVTFAPDSNRFYATLGTGDQRLLIEGDARRQTARVLRDGIECPAISPDGTRLAFKKRVYVDGRLIWRLAVLDLTSLEDRVVDSEERSIDDQVEWLDSESILYAAPDPDRGLGGTSIWAVRVSGGSPQKWLPGAFSPSVVSSATP